MLANVKEKPMRYVDKNSNDSNLFVASSFMQFSCFCGIFVFPNNNLHGTSPIQVFLAMIPKKSSSTITQSVVSTITS